MPERDKLCHSENQRLSERWRNAQWMVAGLLLAGALLFAANWEADRQERVRMDFYRERISDLGRISESIVNGQIHKFDDSLLVLRASYAANPERFAENIMLLRNGPLSDRELLVVLMDRDGYVVYTDATDVKPHLYLGDRNYFRFFAEGGQDLLYIGEPGLGRVTSRYTLPIVRPIYDSQGSLIGVIAISIKQESLVDFAPHLQLSGNTTITIINHGGAVVSRSRDLAKVQGTKIPPELLAPMLNGSEGVFSSRTDPDGAELVIAYRHIHNKETPLIVYVESSPGKVLHEISLQRNVLKWGTVFTSLVIMLLIVVYLKGQRITTQLIDTLRRSKEKEYEALTGTSLDGFYIADSSGRILDTNVTFFKMLGYTKEELLCLSVKDIEAAESPEQVGGHIYTAIEAGITRFESRLRRKDETIIDVEISAQYVKESGKRFFVFVSDITERKQVDDALREREAFLNMLLETIPIPVFYKDSEGRYLGFNKAFEIFFGKNKEQLIGRSVFDIYTPELAKVYYAKDLELFEKPGVQIYESQISNAQCVLHDVIFHKASFINSQGSTTGIVGAILDITERKKAEDKIHELSQLLIQAQENERHLISCELHDSIAQNLSVLKINNDMICNDLSVISPEFREKLAASSSLLLQTIAAVRNLAYDLRLPGLDEMGLVKALESYCEEASENGKTKVDFQTAGMSLIELNGNMEIHIYRLIQEALSNIRKHADADHATIRLLGSSPNIILSIEDNGRGFDVKDQELISASTKRMGILSMQERVNLLQGQMTIQSQPMKGTKIFIKIPWKESHLCKPGNTNPASTLL